MIFNRLKQRKSNRLISSPLGRKQLFFILLFSSLVTLLGTSAQLVVEYRNDIEHIHEQLNQIEKGYLKTLTHSLWKLDDEQINIELNNMLTLRDVVSLEITENGNIVYRAGEAKAGHTGIRKSFDMIYEQEARPVKIGTLNTAASLKGTQERLLQRIFMVLVTQGIKTFLVSFFILFVLHFMVTRHLAVMAGYVRQIVPGGRTPGQLKLARKTPHKDELEDVVRAINGMEKRLGDDIAEINKTLKELRESEKKVRRSQDLLQTVLSSLDEVVLLINPESQTVIDCNATIDRIFGYNQEEVVGRDTAVLHVDDQRAKEFRRTSSQSMHKKGFFSAEWDMKRKDGARFPTEQYQTVIQHKEDAPELIVNIIRDISQREELESQLYQSRKMEAIGTLAGGIAHDFNNVLTIIMGNAELAAQSLPAKKMEHGLVKEIYNASLRAKEMIAQLLKFSKKMDSEFISIDPGVLVEEVYNLMRASTPSNITIEMHIEKNLRTITGDPTQIHQILLNLCTNAIHAMEPRNGRLSIRLTNTYHGGKEDTVLPDISPGNCVLLKISDTGVGISKTDLHKIFDPYFTTKPVDKGTGMGLAVVQGIVAKHGGAITIESQPGQGTTVRVYLPAQEKTSAAAQPPPEEIKRVFRSNASILLVDDEPQVVKLGKEMLEQLGHIVHVSTNPVEALEWFRKASYTIDLLITDLSMPATSGMELAAQIHEIKPDIPVILCSGLSMQVEQQVAEAAGISIILDKPYNLVSLSQAVEEALRCEPARTQ